MSYETVRFWWNRFGPLFAAEIKKKRAIDRQASTQWRWHLDEVFVKIRGNAYYLWRAVDHEGEVLESFVTKKRDRKAALKFLRKAMKHYGIPKSIVTDKLRSYRAAMKQIGIEDRQETGRWLNNRAENSHQPFRRRERGMAKFRSTKSLQKFVSIHTFPDQHWIKLKTNNPLERIMREIRRRTRVVGAFPDGQSELNLAAARLRHIAGTKWSLESCSVVDDACIALPGSGPGR